MNLLHGIMEFMKDTLWVSLAMLDQVNNVADEEANVVEWVIEFVCNAGGQFAKGCQFASLHKLFLLLTQFMLTSLYCLCRLFQDAHDMNHGFATVKRRQRQYSEVSMSCV